MSKKALTLCFSIVGLKLFNKKVKNVYSCRIVRCIKHMTHLFPNLFFDSNLNLESQFHKLIKQ